MFGPPKRTHKQNRKRNGASLSSSSSQEMLLSSVVLHSHGQEKIASSSSSSPSSLEKEEKLMRKVDKRKKYIKKIEQQQQQLYELQKKIEFLKKNQARKKNIEASRDKNFVKDQKNNSKNRTFETNQVRYPTKKEEKEKEKGANDLVRESRGKANNEKHNNSSTQSSSPKLKKQQLKLKQYSEKSPYKYMTNDLQQNKKELSQIEKEKSMDREDLSSIIDKKVESEVIARDSRGLMREDILINNFNHHRHDKLKDDFDYSQVDPSILNHLGLRICKLKYLSKYELVQYKNLSYNNNNLLIQKFKESLGRVPSWEILAHLRCYAGNQNNNEFLYEISMDEFTSAVLPLHLFGNRENSAEEIRQLFRQFDVLHKGEIDVEIIGSIFSYWEKELNNFDKGTDRNREGNVRNTISFGQGSAANSNYQLESTTTILGNSILERNITDPNFKTAMKEPSPANDMKLYPPLKAINLLKALRGKWGEIITELSSLPSSKRLLEECVNDKETSIGQNYKGDDIAKSSEIEKKQDSTSVVLPNKFLYKASSIDIVTDNEPYFLLPGLTNKGVNIITRSMLLKKIWSKGIPCTEEEVDLIWGKVVQIIEKTLSDVGLRNDHHKSTKWKEGLYYPNDILSDTAVPSSIYQNTVDEVKSKLDTCSTSTSLKDGATKNTVEEQENIHPEENFLIGNVSSENKIENKKNFFIMTDHEKSIIEDIRRLKIKAKEQQLRKEYHEFTIDSEEASLEKKVKKMNFPNTKSPTKTSSLQNTHFSPTQTPSARDSQNINFSLDNLKELEAKVYQEAAALNLELSQDDSDYEEVTTCNGINSDFYQIRGDSSLNAKRLLEAMEGKIEHNLETSKTTSHYDLPLPPPSKSSLLSIPTQAMKPDNSERAISGETANCDEKSLRKMTLEEMSSWLGQKGKQAVRKTISKGNAIVRACIKEDKHEESVVSIPTFVSILARTLFPENIKERDLSSQSLFSGKQRDEDEQEKENLIFLIMCCLAFPKQPSDIKFIRYSGIIVKLTNLLEDINQHSMMKAKSLNSTPAQNSNDRVSTTTAPNSTVGNSNLQYQRVNQDHGNQFLSYFSNSHKIQDLQEDADIAKFDNNEAINKVANNVGLQNGNTENFRQIKTKVSEKASGLGIPIDGEWNVKLYKNERENTILKLQNDMEKDTLRSAIHHNVNKYSNLKEQKEHNNPLSIQTSQKTFFNHHPPSTSVSLPRYHAGIRAKMSTKQSLEATSLVLPPNPPSTSTQLCGKRKDAMMNLQSPPRQPKEKEVNQKFLNPYSSSVDIRTRKLKETEKTENSVVDKFIAPIAHVSDNNNIGRISTSDETTSVFLSENQGKSRLQIEGQREFETTISKGECISKLFLMEWSLREKENLKFKIEDLLSQQAKFKRHFVFLAAVSNNRAATSPEAISSPISSVSSDLHSAKEILLVSYETLKNILNSSIPFLSSPFTTKEVDVLAMKATCFSDGTNVNSLESQYVDKENFNKLNEQNPMNVEININPCSLVVSWNSLILFLGSEKEWLYDSIVSKKNDRGIISISSEDQNKARYNFESRKSTLEKVNKFEHAINKESIELVLFRKCFTRKDSFQNRNIGRSECRKDAVNVDVLGLSIHIRHVVQKFNQDGHRDFFRLMDLPKILYDTFSTPFTKMEIDYIAAMCLSDLPYEDYSSSSHQQVFLTTKTLIDFFCILSTRYTRL